MSGAAVAEVAAGGHDVRTAAVCIWSVINLGRMAAFNLGEDKKLWQIRSYCAYAVEVWSRKRKVPMDVQAMVKAWVPIIRGISTGHTKEHIDKCEFAMDEHLKPLLSAPVRQVREFYEDLVKALKADPAVPLFVWSVFEAWHEVILKRAPDTDVLQLKDALAEEVATMVEKDVQPDIQAAIVGALRWRSPEDLEKVRDAVKGGAKPRLKGRESCLFLVVGDGADAPTVML